MDASEVVLGVMPLYHIYGFSVVMNLTLSVGATLVLLERFEVQPFLETLETYGVTTAFLVPPLVRTLASHPLIDRYDVSRLRHVLSAAAPLPEYTAVRCAERIGCEVKQGYGLTETSPATHHTPRGRVKLNAVGVALPGTEWKIVDVATRGDLAVGEIGEVWVRGPQVMKGYFNNLEVTRHVIAARPRLAAHRRHRLCGWRRIPVRPRSSEGPAEVPRPAVPGGRAAADDGRGERPAP